MWISFYNKHYQSTKISYVGKIDITKTSDRFIKFMNSICEYLRHLKPLRGEVVNHKFSVPCSAYSQTWAKGHLIDQHISEVFTDARNPQPENDERTWTEQTNVPFPVIVIALWWHRTRWKMDPKRTFHRDLINWFIPRRLISIYFLSRN